MSRSLLIRAYLYLGPMQAVAAMSAFAFVLHHGGWQAGQSLSTDDSLYLQSTTACLSAIVLMQVANVFLCRSEHQSLFSQGLRGNRILLAGVALEIILILIIDYTPLGNAVFGTAPIHPHVWLFILPFAIGMIALEELRKWVCRRTRRSH